MLCTKEQALLEMNKWGEATCWLWKKPHIPVWYREDEMSNSQLIQNAMHFAWSEQKIKYRQATLKKSQDNARLKLRTNHRMQVANHLQAALHDWEEQRHMLFTDTMSNVDTCDGQLGSIGTSGIDGEPCSSRASSSVTSTAEEQESQDGKEPVQVSVPAARQEHPEFQIELNCLLSQHMSPGKTDPSPVRELSSAQGQSQVLDTQDYNDYSTCTKPPPKKFRALRIPAPGSPLSL